MHTSSGNAWQMNLELRKALQNFNLVNKPEIHTKISRNAAMKKMHKLKTETPSKKQSTQIRVRVLRSSQLSVV